MLDALRHVLTAPPALDPVNAVADWWARHRAAVAPFPAPIDQAIAGGFLADRAGFAFAAGYQAALRALAPSLPPDRLAALCASESAGAHPKVIAAALRPDGARGYVLDGHKRWVTLGPFAEVLLVVATEGRDAQGRNRLRVARVDAWAPGVATAAMDPTPFAPEIPHAEVTFTGVAVGAGDVLPGDGYERYVKPFRTVEDAHVMAAVLGHHMAVARRYGWPRPVVEDLAARLLALRAAGAADPLDAALHVALAGVLRDVARWLEESAPCWSRVDEAVRARWARDRLLLEVARGVRERRADAAWKALGA